jgi:hypothetical protein
VLLVIGRIHTSNHNPGHRGHLARVRESMHTNDRLGGEDDGSNSTTSDYPFYEPLRSSVRTVYLRSSIMRIYKEKLLYSCSMHEERKSMQSHTLYSDAPEYWLEEHKWYAIDEKLITVTDYT